jgi:xanthine dehydrogenase accessory factor
MVVEPYPVHSPGDVALDWQKAGVSFARITVAEAEGSTPREQGAVMLVSGQSVTGTIGGGRLEWDAIASARNMLAAGLKRKEMTVHLGPAIGQCCGGRMRLLIEQISDSQIAAMAATEMAGRQARPTVLIYGAGHVGRALAQALVPLPFRITVVDGRPEELERTLAPGVRTVLTDSPLSLAEAAPATAAHVVMTHSHALDSLIAAAVLDRGQFRYLGIIGSRTKRNSFRRAFRELGFTPELIARVICPIGGGRIRDKRPEVIAALAAAEITAALLGGD